MCVLYVPYSKTNQTNFSNIVANVLVLEIINLWLGIIRSYLIANYFYICWIIYCSTHFNWNCVLKIPVIIEKLWNSVLKTRFQLYVPYTQCVTITTFTLQVVMDVFLICYDNWESIRQCLSFSSFISKSKAHIMCLMLGKTSNIHISLSSYS